MSLQRADDPHRGSQHAGLRAGTSRRRHLGKHRAVAGCAPAEHAHITGESQHRGAHQRRAGALAGIAQHVRHRQAVRGIQHDVGARDQRGGVGRRHAQCQRLDLNLRVQSRERRAGGRDLAVADIGHAEQRLAVQVGLFDHVGVGQQQPAHPGGRKIRQHGTAEAAGPDHQHARARQARLPRSADLRQH